jgi:nicotinamidase-related amidase
VPLELEALLAPATAAVVTSECQRGVIGPDAMLAELAGAATDTVIPNGARVCAAARAAGVPVVHCLAGWRPDNKGSNHNARLFAAIARSPQRVMVGTPGAEVVEAFAVSPDDIVLSRIHGLSPMAGTDLDPVLRNLGVTTLIVVGVSVNVAITNLTMDAVNHGYQVVIVRDAVAGVPPSYAEQVIDNTLSYLATILTTDDVEAAWMPPPGPGADFPA